MDISARTMYGLRALATLAKTRSEDPMSIQAIADEEDLPSKFLEGIMGDLKRGGFVRSRRGANGGYFLARPASEITVLDVIRHLDGPVAPLAFGEDRGSGTPTPCESAFQPVWQEVREATIRVLESYSIQAIAEGVPVERHESFTPNYQI